MKIYGQKIIFCKIFLVLKNGFIFVLNWLIINIFMFCNFLRIRENNPFSKIPMYWISSEKISFSFVVFFTFFINPIQGLRGAISGFCKNYIYETNRIQLVCLYFDCIRLYLQRHYRNVLTTIYSFHKKNSSRHNIKAFEIRYYNSNSQQRRYRNRHWIPMFNGTPCRKTDLHKEKIRSFSPLVLVLRFEHSFLTVMQINLYHF